MLVYELKPKPAAARFKAWVCVCSLAGIAGSNLSLVSAVCCQAGVSATD